MPAKIIKQVVPLEEVPPGEIFTKLAGEKEYRRLKEVMVYHFAKASRKLEETGGGVFAVSVLGGSLGAKVSIQVFDPKKEVVWRRRIPMVDATISEHPLMEGTKWDTGFYFLNSVTVDREGRDRMPAAESR